MIIKNKLDKSFGPAGSSAGILLFIVGIIALFFSNIGLILFLLGAFLAFTYTSTWYNIDKKRIKFTENTFGLIPHGKWIDIEPDMLVEISKWKQGFQVFSQSNKSTKIINEDFRIVLYTANHEKIMAIKKFKTHELAEKELTQFALQFGLNISSESKLE